MAIAYPFVPLNKRILVRPDKPATQAGKILLPQNTEKQPQSGVVVSGADKTFLVDNGDRVFFSAFAATEMEIDNEKLLIVKLDDLFGVVAGGK